MVINYQFSDHKEASLLRDNGNLDHVQELMNEHLKQLRMSEFKGDRSVITLEAEDGDDQGANDAGLSEDEIKVHVSANLVTMKKVHSGLLLVTTMSVTFQASESRKYHRIPLETIKKVFFRHYRRIPTDRRSYFIDFVNTQQRQQVLLELKKLPLPACNFLQLADSDIQVLIDKVVGSWRSGKLSNFDDLMKLNILAGRTYNDLGQ
jgi:hypothetical protein